MNQINKDMSVLSREKLVAQLEKKYPEMNCKDTEQFNGAKGGIWLSGEDGIENDKGLELFNYYAEGDNYIFGVEKSIEDWVNSKGWFFEWNDPGTIMLWRI